MNERELRFCRCYASDPNAIQSALDAGYSQSYSEKQSHNLLRRPHVIDEIKRLRQRVNERAEKSATDVVNEYATVAFTDRVDFLKPDDMFPGCFVNKAPDELTEEQRACVETVNTTWRKIERTIDGEKVSTERQEYNYVLADKMGALQQMGRHFGIFDDKLRLEQGTKNPFANATPEQLQRLKAQFVSTMSGGAVIEHKTGEVVKVNGRN